MRINKINNIYYFIDFENGENNVVYNPNTKKLYPFQKYEDLDKFIQVTTNEKELFSAIQDKEETRLNDLELENLRRENPSLFATPIYLEPPEISHKELNSFTKRFVNKLNSVEELIQILSLYVINEEVLINIIRELYKVALNEELHIDEDMNKKCKEWYYKHKWNAKANGNEHLIRPIAEQLITRNDDEDEDFTTAGIISIIEKDIRHLNMKYGARIFEQKYSIKSIKDIEELYDKELIDYKGNRKNLVLMTIQAIGTKLGVHSYKQIVNGISGTGKTTNTDVFGDMVEIRRFGLITDANLKNKTSKDFNRLIFVSNDQTIEGDDNINKYVGAFIGRMVTDHQNKYEKMSTGGKYQISNDIKVASIGIIEQGVELSPGYDDKGQIERRNEYIDIATFNDYTKERKNRMLGKNSNDFKALHKAWIEYNFYHNPVIKNYNFDSNNEYKSFIESTIYNEFIEHDSLEAVLNIKDYDHMLGILITCARIFKHKLTPAEVEELTLYFERNKETSLENLLWKFIKNRISYRKDCLDFPDSDNGYDIDDKPETKQDLIVGYRTNAENSVFFTPKNLISYKLNQGTLASEFEVLRLNESLIGKLCIRLAQKGKLGKVDIRIGNRIENYYYILKPDS